MADIRSRAVGLRLQVQASSRSSGRQRCICCECTFDNFESYVDASGVSTEQCPSCGSHPRHRSFAELFASLGSVRNRSARLLHVSPEPSIRAVIGRYWAGSVVSLDLHRRGVDLQASVESLPFADKSFDAVICSHVLEHVVNDRRALDELRRIVPSQAWLWLQVPVEPAMALTRAADGLDDSKLRGQLLGESDHHRLYGLDIVDRLAVAGFGVFMEEDRSVRSDRFISNPGQQESLILARPI